MAIVTTGDFYGLPTRIISGQHLRLEFLAEAGPRIVRLSLGGSDEKRSTARLRQDLAAGETIEVAGYALNPALARAIDGASLSVPDGYCGRILWLETGLDDAAELPPASAQKVAALTAAGHVVTSRTVPGRAFWQTVEIEECPALVGATVAALRELPITDHARP